MIDSSLPLIDLHRHLDGSVRLETILDLGRAHNLPLPAWDAEGLRPHVQVLEPQPGIMAFIARFKWMTGVLVDYDACRRVAYESMEDAGKEGIHYIELRFSPLFMAEPHGLDPVGVVEAVADGVAAGSRTFGVRCGLIGILSRTYGPELAWRELDALLSQRERIRGLDLAGDEAHYPGEWFEPHFKRARLAGWHITAHAGEADGPRSIWQALNGLGAERIGHAVRAPEDPALMDWLAEKQIGIEVSLTSNVQTTTVGSYASHPLRLFMQRGLRASLNSDDPGISGITLRHEYEVAAPAAGLDEAMTRQAQRNALETAFLTPGERAALLQDCAGRSAPGKRLFH
jgi:adenosine deaminase